MCTCCFGGCPDLVGLSTLDKIMKSCRIGRIEKCQPFPSVHRFGTHGTPTEPEFGAIIPWAALNTKGAKHEFNLKAEVLEGDHCLFIGFLTIISMKYSLGFSKLRLCWVSGWLRKEGCLPLPEIMSPRCGRVYIGYR
jgi:hypothetical protein